MVKKLIDLQVDPLAETEDNFTPIQLAVASNQIGTLEVLLKYLSSEFVQKQNQRGNALHVAAFFGNIPAIEILLRNEFDPFL